MATRRSFVRCLVDTPLVRFSQAAFLTSQLRRAYVGPLASSPNEEAPPSRTNSLNDCGLSFRFCLVSFRIFGRFSRFQDLLFFFPSPPQGLLPTKCQEQRRRVGRNNVASEIRLRDDESVDIGSFTSMATPETRRLRDFNSFEHFSWRDFLLPRFRQHLCYSLTPSSSTVFAERRGVQWNFSWNLFKILRPSCHNDRGMRSQTGAVFVLFLKRCERVWATLTLSGRMLYTSSASLLFFVICVFAIPVRLGHRGRWAVSSYL